jgi:hypothetical protein
MQNIYDVRNYRGVSPLTPKGEYFFDVMRLVPFSKLQCLEKVQGKKFNYYSTASFRLLPLKGNTFLSEDVSALIKTVVRT